MDAQQRGARLEAVRRGQIIFPTKSERWGKLAELNFQDVRSVLISADSATIIMNDERRIVL
jgi:hypothetical protein